MLIDIRYDPVAPATNVWVNGVKTNENDIYGLLYPVRHCLIQTYLKPSGSWPGLKARLNELRRGEEMTLTFHGRACDFEDVKEALGGEGAIGFEEIAPTPIDEQALRTLINEALDEEVSAEWDDGGAARVRGRELFAKEAGRIDELLGKESDWLSRIDDEADFRLALRSDTCCLVSEKYLGSFDRLESLRALTRSLRRADEMILCAFSDESALQDFSDYARSLGLGYGFAAEADEDAIRRLYDKYGAACLERSARRRILPAVAVLEELCVRKAGIDERLRQLRRLEQEDSELELRQAYLKRLTHKMPAIRQLAAAEN